jgi:hypothetical protein
MPRPGINFPEPGSEAPHPESLRVYLGPHPEAVLSGVRLRAATFSKPDPGSPEKPARMTATESATTHGNVGCGDLASDGPEFPDPKSFSYAGVRTTVI